MKFSFPVEVEQHLRQFVRDDQGRRIVSITIKEVEGDDNKEADMLVSKPRSAKPDDLMAWAEARATCLLALCVVGYEVEGALPSGADPADTRVVQPVSVVCKRPNDGFHKWSAKAKALATAYYGQLNGADEGQVNAGFQKAQAVP